MKGRESDARKLTPEKFAGKPGHGAHYFNLGSCQSLPKGSLILPQSFQEHYESRPTVSPSMPSQ